MRRRVPLIATTPWPMAFATRGEARTDKGLGVLHAAMTIVSPESRCRRTVPATYVGIPVICARRYAHGAVRVG
jgi:hypothetical protein